MTYISEKIYQDMITFRPADFNYELFSGFMNYPPGKAIPATIKSVLDEKLLPDIGHAPVSYQYRILPIAARHARLNDIIVKNTYHLNGNLVYRLLRGSTHVIAHLISTPGETVNDIAEIYIYYAYYNTLLQMSADHLRKVLIQRCEIPEIQLTRRYAPGYCGWPIHDQNVLLKLLEPAAIGVRFTESMMLEPAHSTSGIFGLRQQPRIGGNMPCYNCTSLTCKVHDDFNKELRLIEGVQKF